MTFISNTHLAAVVITRADFPRLITALQGAGWQVIGPKVLGGAIGLAPLQSVDDLPQGRAEQQSPGRYKVVPGTAAALFGFNVGPDSWKKYLRPAQERLWVAEKKQNGSINVVPDKKEPPKLALLGVRPCDLAALQILDRVFLKGSFVDAAYRQRRERMFVVAVNCGQAGGTCFCASMQTGPKASAGFDLALTEVIAGDQHYFVVETGSETGRHLLAQIPQTPASSAHQQAADLVIATARQNMGRQMDTLQIKELLYRNLEHPRWEEVAQRCLTCGNCTMACPTCFCANIEDTTDITGQKAERWRRWDSCFSLDFSYYRGRSVRQSPKSRYRQWLIHKLATWQDQFGTSGCVGCGRCLTWCPVGIDITEEVAAIRAHDAGPAAAAEAGVAKEGNA